jgi:hypothetical protein
MAGKLSFKEGTTAREARGVMAEKIKSGEIKTATKEPFALATYITKRMSAGKRKSVAARR